MAHSRRRTGLTWVAGVRTVWRVVADGEFYCPDCGGDRCYQRLEGRRRLTVLGMPLLPRGTAVPVIECSFCRNRFTLQALSAPTTVRLSLMLRDAVQTIALAVLAAGGTESRAAREAAVDSVRTGGHPDCTEERLLTLLAVVGAEGDDALENELRSTLAPLAPHLATVGRETLLRDAARIALADGRYLAAESAALAEIGNALALAPTDTERLLTEAGQGV
ncbi:TerB family tellurite resistance protein [Streptomyces bohaiensis]|uniref:TerB family tellurite resistance protein n=1 Tax=Streptomyces bohaiensis TaxID=1431344 RepID=UPI0028A62500|nr:TerB family tellurite resistance protein [Streptomyces bohaiensis]